jgi:cobaltochelatase CobN
MESVINFEILSNQLLVRPRVDVALRVSGFFRNALPNVIKLYDAAIQALATYDEAPEINSIRAHTESGDSFAATQSAMDRRDA